MNSTLKLSKTVTVLLLIFMSVVPSVSVTAQNPYFRSIKVPDEFQQTSITSLYQDKRGFIWIGTGKGLYQYDGNDFFYIPVSGKTDPLQVSAVYMDSTYTLWVGTRKGEIFTLQTDSLIAFSPEEGNPSVAVTAFAIDAKGNLWYSTYGEGLYCLNGKRIVNLNTDDGLTDNYCYTITTDYHGRIWAATDGGISVCTLEGSNKKIERITTSEGLPDNIVVELRRQGSVIWVGMQDAGICSVNERSLKVSFSEASANWQSGPVGCIVATNNWLWLATEGHGIINVMLPNGRISGSVSSFDKYSLTRINRIFADQQGNYWVTSGSQLFFSLGSDLVEYTESTTASSQNLHSVFPDSKGNLWYSDEKGLFRLNRNTGKPEPYPLPFRKPVQIISMYEDKYGHIWAGTFGDGLVCFNPENKKFRLFNETDGLSNGNILSITGKNDQLWLATLGGAYTFRIPDDPFPFSQMIEFVNYGDKHFQGNNYIYSVFIDSRNRVWFGTDGKGISVLEKGRFTQYNEASGLRSNTVYSITEDSDGDVWFSTSDAGIYRYNGKTFRNYSQAEGISDMGITGLLADKKHHLIIVHNNGVDILDTRSNAFKYYSGNAGLAEINPDLNVCALESPDKAWIGTRKGLVMLRIPEDVNKHQPLLQLSKISVFLGSENFLGEKVFRYNQNHISFHFNALWYMAPSQVKYQIRLDGYDLDWIDTRNNLVTYSNLPAGKYTFKVRAALKGNFENSEVITYSFTVTKPFWKTNWFIILAILVLGGLLSFFIYLREKNLRQRDAEAREKLMFQFQTLRSQVNPHFLFNSFSTLISIIDEDKEVAIDYVEKLSKFFRDILDYRDRDLIPLSEELTLIDTYIYLQKKRYCDNLKVEISIHEPYRNTLIPPMVLQMLVENAVKHNIVSADKPLWVRITTDEQFIEVCNNRQAKKIDVPSTGIGLTNIRNRYNLLGCGEIQIISTAEEFSVKLPLIHPPK